MNVTVTPEMLADFAGSVKGYHVTCARMWKDLVFDLSMQYNLTDEEVEELIDTFTICGFNYNIYKRHTSGD